MMTYENYIEILHDYEIKEDEYINVFIKFLLDKEKMQDISDDTLMQYFVRYINIMHELEIVWKNPLALWNEEDVTECIQGMCGNSPSTAKAIFSLIDMFEEWAVKNGFNPAYNPCDSLNVKEIMTFNKAALKEKIVDIDTLFKLWDKVQQSSTDLSELVDEQSFAIILLARLGLQGKKYNEILALQLEDLDRENNKINVTNRVRYLKKDEEQPKLEIIKVIEDVEDRIFDILEKASELKEDVIRGAGGRTAEVLYVDEGFIIKRNERNNEITFSVLRKKMEFFFTASEHIFMNISQLFRNKMIEDLYKIEETRELMTTDFKEVFKKYNNGRTNYNDLLKYYTTIFDTKIKKANKFTGETKEIRTKKYQNDYYNRVTKLKRAEKRKTKQNREG